MELSANAIRKSFDESFGPGAGNKVMINCKKDGHRNLIVELQIALKGRLNGASMADVMKGAKNKPTGCDTGIVDPVGLQ